MLAADAVGVVAGTLGGNTEHILAGRDIDIVHDLGEGILLFLLGRVRFEERQLALVTVHDIEDNHAGSGKGPLSSGCFAIRRRLCRCLAMNWSARN